MVKKILIGTTNPAKKQRFMEILNNYDCEIVKLDDLNITDEPEELGNTPIENAKIKAEFYSKFCDNVICQDSGLYFADMDEDDPRQPGLYIKRVGNEVLSYEGMITYYSNMAKNFGGKALVYYKNGTAVFSDNCFKEFMADDKTNKARGFYLLDHQICEPIPGWPLDSISQDIENHDKETENLLREYDIKFRKFIIDSFKLKKIEK